MSDIRQYATDHWNPDLCRLLLDECELDAEAEDDFKRYLKIGYLASGLDANQFSSTGVGIAWQMVLSGRMSANDASIIAGLFRKYDYLESQAFTPIHKTVLGLASKSLHQELSCSTAEIDTKDASGRTAVSWASARGDESSLVTLLKHGADANLADSCGQAPLHYARNTACAQLLLDHGASVKAVNGEGQTPLYTACRNVWSASLVTHLLGAGSEVNASDHSDQTSLHAACGNGKSMPYIFVLLDAGADIKLRNNSGDTPLAFSVIFNMHDVLIRMLKDPEADFSNVNLYGHSFGHVIARTADLETVTILTEARPQTLKPDMNQQDRNGKSCLDYFEERLFLLDEGETEELSAAFQRLLTALTSTDEVTAVGNAETLAITGKTDIVVRLTELVIEDEEPASVGEVYHDAVEAF